MDVTQADDSDIRQSMDAFEAALTAEEPTLPDVSVNTILLAIDGSNQDAAAVQAAITMAKRHQASVVIACAYEGESNTQLDAVLAATRDKVAEAGVDVRSASRPKNAGRSFEQLLAAVDAESYDLLVVCAPYLDDFDQLGSESVGSNLDMLMTRAKVPILVIRQPLGDVAECLSSWTLLITPYKPSLVAAAAWSLTLATSSGGMRLLAVIDPENLEESKAIPQDADIRELDAESLAGLHEPASAGLVAAVQRRANETGVDCSVKVIAGDPLEQLAKHINAEPTIAVLACPSDSTTMAHRFARDFTRQSLMPVLIV